jgi:hypothetical protein
VLIRNLPRESATYRAYHGAKAEWGDAEHMLALTVDNLAALNFIVLKGLYGKRATVKAPTPLPRPGEEATLRTPKPRRFATGREVAAFLARHSRGGAQ